MEAAESESEPSKVESESESKIAVVFSPRSPSALVDLMARATKANEHWLVVALPKQGGDPVYFAGRVESIVAKTKVVVSEDLGGGLASKGPLRKLEIFAGEGSKTFARFEGKAQTLEVVWITAVPSKRVDFAYSKETMVVDGENPGASIPLPGTRVLLPDGNEWTVERVRTVEVRPMLRKEDKGKKVEISTGNVAVAIRWESASRKPLVLQPVVRNLKLPPPPPGASFAVLPVFPNRTLWEYSLSGLVAMAIDKPVSLDERKKFLDSVTIVRDLTLEAKTGEEWFKFYKKTPPSSKVPLF